MRLIWLLLPDSAIPLLIVGVGLLLIVGVLSRGRAISIIGGLLAYLIFAPFAGVLLALFPWWVSPLLLVVFVMSVLRAASALFLGERASDHMVGILAACVVMGTFKAFLFPFRLLARLAKSS
jgi:hypothetical protein